MRHILKSQGMASIKVKHFQKFTKGTQTFMLYIKKITLISKKGVWVNENEI